MRHHLKKLDMEQIKDVNYHFLVDPIQDILPKGKKCIFAIDSTDDPYYGEIVPQNREYVIGSRLKKSTSTFYRYISLYLIEGERKLTLSMLPARNDISVLDYIVYFLDVIDRTGLEVKALLLDREFYSVDILSHLTQRNTPFIMPVKRQSARMKEFLSKGRCSRAMKYRMSSQGKGSVDLTVLKVVKYLKGRGKKHGILRVGYVINNIAWKPQKIAKTYEKRFAIESSYRMRNTVRARTTTKCPTIRYLLALISMLLKNVWAAIRWRYFTIPKQGPRQVVKDAFRFDHYRLIIWNTIASRLGFKHKVPVIRDKG
jgi:putative transposase